MKRKWSRIVASVQDRKDHLRYVRGMASVLRRRKLHGGLPGYDANLGGFYHKPNICVPMKDRCAGKIGRYLIPTWRLLENR